MRIHTPVLGVIAALLLQPVQAGTIELSDCQLSPPRGAARLAARCGSLSVPEDPDQPDGPRIELRLAVVAALARTPAPDPVVFIAGGPGQSALDNFPSLAGAFGAIRRERDIVLVDQRGTGGSNLLECAEGDVADGARSIAEQVDACVASLPGDPRFYTTSVAVRDLDAVREALGYPTWNLYGISYGTRVAQHYLRRYPERTRAVIIDGVVPPTLPLGPRISLDAQAALELVFERCAADPACDARFPGLDFSFDALRAELAARPQEVHFPDPLNATPTTIMLDAEAFANAVHLLSYMPETVSLLPLLIHTAEVDGDLAPLAAQAQMVTTDLASQIATGMHSTVVCTEDTPRYADDPGAHSELMTHTYLGAMQFEVLVEICDAWPAGVIDPDFGDELVSAIPVLLLSGEADPVTPPSNAELAAATLSRSRQLTGAGQGHGIAVRGCVSSLMATFLTDLDPEGLDASCMERMRPTPFFTSFSGWEP